VKALALSFQLHYLKHTDGTVVDADGDMLKGLRGGGSNLGVVVELTVKVYPFENVRLTFGTVSHSTDPYTDTSRHVDV